MKRIIAVNLKKDFCFQSTVGWIFFSKWTSCCSNNFFSCLSSYGLMFKYHFNNVFSVLLFFTFIWIRLHALFSNVHINIPGHIWGHYLAFRLHFVCCNDYVPTSEVTIDKCFVKSIWQFLEGQPMNAFQQCFLTL